MFSKLLKEASIICSSAAERIDSLSISEIPAVITAVKKGTTAILDEATFIAQKTINERVAAIVTAKRAADSEEFKAKTAAVSKTIFGNIGKGIGFIAKTAKTIGTTPANDIKEGFSQSFSK